MMTSSRFMLFGRRDRCRPAEGEREESQHGRRTSAVVMQILDENSAHRRGSTGAGPGHSHRP